MSRWLSSAVWLAAATTLGYAQNWAQMVGYKDQNTAISAASPWSPRWGHAVTVIENRQPANAAPLPADQATRVFVLGGETYVTGDVPGTFNYGGSGQLNNDVWRSITVNWKNEPSTVARNQWGDPLPRILSQASWIPTTNSLPPLSPTALSYEDWLCCAGNVDWGCKTINCDAGDPFAGSRRWSPRRDHTAVTYISNGLPFILVLGGRALGLSSNTSEVVNGGVADSGGGHLRMQLTNDVWSSRDGVVWNVQSVGCSVPTAPFMVGLGAKAQQCKTNNDCIRKYRFGSSSTVSCSVYGQCVCNTWQPRERHSSVVLNDQIFVAGGVTTTTRQKCATLSCGGGYRVFLNDVWYSQDMGVTWHELTPHAPWRPRADFAMTISPLSTSPSGYKFWLMAGRGGVGNDYSDNPMFSDIWWSYDGAIWVEEAMPSPWGPRAGAQVVFGDDVTFDSRNQAQRRPQLLLVGGEQVILPSPSPTPMTVPQQAVEAARHTYGIESSNTGTGTGTGADYALQAALEKAARIDGEKMLQLNDVWKLPLDVDGANWTLDYSPETVWYNYVSPDTPLTAPVLDYPEGYLQPLTDLGILTVADLAAAPGDQITVIMQNSNITDLCTIKGRMEALHYKCANQPYLYDGQFMLTLKYINGLGVVNPDPVELDPCVGLRDYTQSSTDLPCRQVIAPRRGFKAVMFEDWPMVLGGYENANVYDNDVWYRDSQIPVTVITTTPSSGSSDTVIAFSSNLQIATFEYQLFHGRVASDATLMRNWTLTEPSIDYKDWLSGGTYTFQVRAITPAGNRDPYILERNSLTWTYVPALPWLLIILAIVVAGLIIVAVIVYYRRRRRQRALEKYALKRKRRKLKAAKAGDWRNYYKKGVLDKKKKKSKKKKSKKGGKSSRSSRSKGSKTGGRSSRSGDRSARSGRSGSKGGKSSRSDGKRSARSDGKKSSRSKSKGDASSRSKK